MAASAESPTKEQPAASAKAPSKGAGKEDAKKDKKDKKGQAAADPDRPSIAAHPRAARAVARAKGWGGLIGFFVAGYLALPTSTFVAAGLRALVAGLVCYVAVWAGAVFLWRRLVILEVKSREQKLLPAPPVRPPRRGPTRASGR